MTQAKNLSFLYLILKSYCPLNFRKSHQISWFCWCCIPDGSHKEDNLKEGRICQPPPSPPCGTGFRSNSGHFRDSLGRQDHLRCHTGFAFLAKVALVRCNMQMVNMITKFCWKENELLCERNLFSHSLNRFSHPDSAQSA